MDFLGAYTGSIIEDFVLVSSYWRVYWDGNDFQVDYYPGILTYEEGGDALDLGETTPDDINDVNSNEFSTYQYCEGRNLVKFRESPVYPFYAKVIYENNFACAQIVCDLRFNTNPLITTTYAEVEATSSYLPVEYSLNQNFVYGTGRPFGTFDLAAGPHTIYAKDGAGCTASINITIPTADGYDLKYTSNYFDIKGNPTTIEIYEYKYTGGSSEVRAGGNPLIISWGRRGELKTEPIKGSEANITFLSETDRQFIDLFTSDARKYRVDIKKGSDLFWRGFLIPEFWQEPYLQPPYPVQLGATDGLGDLKNLPFVLVNAFDYTSVAQHFSGRMSHLEVIVICLNKLGLELPIYTAVNVFEENMEYLDGQGVLIATYEPEIEDVFYPTSLVAGVKYNFKLIGNLETYVSYNGVHLNEGAISNYGFVNSDFDDAIYGWEGVSFGNGLEWYDYEGFAQTFTRSDIGNTRSNILRQAYQFLAGVEYTLKVYIKRENHSATSRSRLRVFAGTTSFQIQIISSEFSYFNEEITATFTPATNSHQYINLYVIWENTEDKEVYIDYVRLISETDAIAEWSYTPTESNGELFVQDPTKLEVYESVKDPIYSTYVDTSNYYIDGEPMNCYEVLQQQLLHWGARIFQTEGAWHIVKFDQLNGEYQRNRYTKDGVYEYSELYQPIINLTVPSLSDKKIWVNKDMQLEISPGYKMQIAEQSLGYIESLIKGEFDYDDFYPSSTAISGALKYFTFGQYFSGDPVWYLRRALDNEGNYGLDFNYNIGSINLVEVVDYIIISGLEGDDFEGDYVLWGLPPSGEIKEGDIVLVEYNYDSSLTNIYEARNKNFWTPLLPYDYSAYVKVMQGSLRGNYYSLQREYEVIDGEAGDLIGTITNLSDVTPELLTEGLLINHSWIKTQPINIEFADDDKILIKIGYILNIASHPMFGGSIYNIGLEVKLGDYYLGHWGEFVREPQWIQIPIFDSKKLSESQFEFTTRGINLTSPADFTIKVWCYTTADYSPSEYDVTNGSWGNVNLNFGLDFTVYTNFTLDYIKAIYLPGGFPPDTSTTHRLDNSLRYNHTPETIQVIHGDVPDVLNNDKLYTQHLTLADGTLTQFWKRKSYYERKNLLKLLLESILSNNLRSNQLINGTLQEYLTLMNTIFDPENPDKVFMINAVEYMDYQIHSMVQLAEITMNENLGNNADAAFTVGFSVGFKS